MNQLLPPLGTTTSLARPGVVLACLCLATFPALLLRTPAVANACFGVLLAFSLLALGLSDSARREAWQACARDWPLMAAMAAMPLAVVCNQLATRPGLPHVQYLYLRFALFAPLAWGLLWLGTPARIIQWGFVAGAIASALWMQLGVVHGRPMHIGIFNLIPFTNLSLLMGMLSLIAIGWSRGRRWEIALKVLAGVAGLYASFLSGTRGSWIAIPVLLLVVVMSAGHIGKPRLRWPLLLASLVVLGVLGYTSEFVTSRWNEAVQHLRVFAEGQNVDTPEGFRLQLWRASVLLFARHPWVGIGPGHWRPAVAELTRSGDLTALAASFDHSHNDLLYAAVTLGVPGLLAMVATYLAPGLYFLRNMRHPDEGARVAAALGLATVAGFFIFGLTETMFYVSVVNAFYALVLATCYALVAGSKARLAVDER